MFQLAICLRVLCLRRVLSGRYLHLVGSRLRLRWGSRGRFRGEDGVQLPLQALEHLLGVLGTHPCLSSAHDSRFQHFRSSSDLHRHCSFMVYMVQGRASLSTCDNACNSFWRPFMLHRRREDGYRWLLC